MTLLSRGGGRSFGRRALQVGQWCEQKKERPDDPPEKRKAQLGVLGVEYGERLQKKQPGQVERRATSVSRCRGGEQVEQFFPSNPKKCRQFFGRPNGKHTASKRRHPGPTCVNRPLALESSRHWPWQRGQWRPVPRHPGGSATLGSRFSGQAPQSPPKPKRGTEPEPTGGDLPVFCLFAFRVHQRNTLSLLQTTRVHHQHCFIAQLPSPSNMAC